MRKLILLLSAGAVLASPAVLAAQAVRYLDPREVAEAQQQHSALIAEFGGAETGPRGAYVESVGRRVAAYSGVANSGAAFRFTTLNSAVENAFAVPGGYVYITRQLMTLMDDESQLAFALGHETRAHRRQPRTGRGNRSRGAIRSRVSSERCSGACSGAASVMPLRR